MIVCADDYGISPATSEGIRDLIERGLISSTTCILTRPSSLADLKKLRSVAGVDIGLHFTLPSPRGGFLKLGEVARSLLHTPGRQIEAELERQHKIFTQVMGRTPDFYDGHQHIHILPKVANALAEFSTRVAGPVHIRLSQTPVSGPATFFLNAISRRAARVFARAGLHTTGRLYGYHDYNAPNGFARMLAAVPWEKVEARDVLYCHPGRLDPSLRDVDDLIESRQEVLDFIREGHLRAQLRAQGLNMNRFSAATPRRRASTALAVDLSP